MAEEVANQGAGTGTLINESDLVKTKTSYEIKSIVDLAACDTKGVAVAEVDGNPVTVIADMPVFADVEKFAFVPTERDEINPSLNPSTLLDM